MSRGLRMPGTARAARGDQAVSHRCRQGPLLKFRFFPLVLAYLRNLGTLVPALPGHFGSYEYFGLLSFDMVQVDRTMATAVILLAHLILWMPTALFGIVWLLTTRKDRDRKAWLRTEP